MRQNACADHLYTILSLEISRLIHVFTPHHQCVPHKEPMRNKEKESPPAPLSLPFSFIPSPSFIARRQESQAQRKTTTKEEVATDKHGTSGNSLCTAPRPHPLCLEVWVQLHCLCFQEAQEHVHHCHDHTARPTDPLRLRLHSHPWQPPLMPSNHVPSYICVFRDPFNIPSLFSRCSCLGEK